MSVQSEINRLKQNVANAFTAVGNKGDTVPASKVSGNLASAINSIPLGVTVQRTTGRFTLDADGVATVNCGFRPDVVIIKGKGYTSETRTIYYDFVSAFAERSANQTYRFQGGDDQHPIMEGETSQTTNGFSVALWAYDWS